MNLNDVTYVREACLNIGYDNGLINRFCTEGEWLEKCEEVLFADGVSTADVTALNTFLASLTPEQRETLCCGEATEIQALEADAPFAQGQDIKVTKLLNDVFEMA